MATGRAREEPIEPDSEWTRRPSPSAPMPPGRITAASSIYTDLRRAILDMRLAPGSALAEKTLTDRYGVSRTPVREALIRLSEEGLVDVFPQSGTFVGRIPLDALPEAVIIRQALECAAVELATQAITLPAADVLDAIIARQEAMAGIGDQDRFHAADEAFHEMLAKMAGYPGIWRLAQQAKAQIDRCRRLTLPVPGRMLMVVAEHRSIVEAMRQGDSAGAAMRMKAHLCALLPDMVTAREKQPDYFR